VAVLRQVLDVNLDGFAQEPRNREGLAIPAASSDSALSMSAALFHDCVREGRSFGDESSPVRRIRERPRIGLAEAIQLLVSDTQSRSRDA
jgi:hypothetical protein